MSSVLQLTSITCRFHDGGNVVGALAEATLTVETGRLVAVVGPSGSGKSTLIHVACGLVTPDAGEVRVLDQPAPPPGAPARSTRRWWADARRATIGVVHQRLNLVPALSAAENVALPLRLQGHDRRSAAAAARDALAEVNAQDWAEAGVDRLSMGQQQRIALARAIVGGRKLILADEPTAALDTVGAEQVAELLAGLAAAGRAVLMVTHDSRLASWADEVVVLRDGRVVDRVSAGAVA